ncbi:MAG: 50S ribosomal protein L6 [Chitinivibrionales bacterium]|nr:50S ribosomal protein L6 [Chitinivibrionales bacterium]
MSRIGKNPISLPTGVEVKRTGTAVEVKGPKGTLAQEVPEEFTLAIGETEIKVAPPSQDKAHFPKWGLYRILVQNMVTGVSSGFKKDLEIIGVGYKVDKRGKDLIISVGYSHPIWFRADEGITLNTDGPNKISVEGIDKRQVGQVASDIRSIRPPEPYKGKGIRYAGEYVRTKAGKANVK